MSPYLKAATSLLLFTLSSLGLYGCGADTHQPDGGRNDPGDCIAGETRCEGLVPQTCTSDGAWLDADPCTFVCSEGECTGVCVPGSRQCDGPVTQLCGAEGAWLIEDECEFGCSAGNCTGVCAPGSKRCEGLVPESCDSEGAWIAEPACDYLCTEGECAGECVPGNRQCDGLVPETCDATGAWAPADPCDFVCAEGECAGVCVPGSKQCDGLVPETCDATGNWIAADTCDFVCAEGECAGECVPGSKQCDGLVPETCDATGAWAAADACDFICAEGECAGECVPGSKQCDGLVPETCDAAGAWVAGDTCDFVCAAGSCTGVCVPGVQQCTGATTIETCDATGTWRASSCPQSCSTRTNACACDPGYHGDGQSCTPIDFCNAPDGGCSPRATCSQAGPTPSCTCNPGFEGDGYSCSAQTTLLDEGFDDISTLPAQGWSLENRSAPIGIHGWGPGHGLHFSGFDGAQDHYIVANFESTGAIGTISNWLVTPPLDFGARASLSFLTRTAGNGYADRIEVRVCPQLPCDLPASDSSVGAYSVLLGSVNPNLDSHGYPSSWTRFEYTNAVGIPWSGRGRLAIRYFVTSAGSSGDNSDYIGVDRLVVKAGEPAYEVAGTVSGLTAGTVVLWLNGSEQLHVHSNGAFAFGRKLDDGTPYSVSVFAQPQNQACTISNAAGTIAGSNVIDVQVTCNPY